MVDINNKLSTTGTKAYVENEINRILLELMEYKLVSKFHYNNAETFDKKKALLRGAILHPKIGFPSWCLTLGIPYFQYKVIDDFYSKVMDNHYNLGMWARSCLKSTSACAFAGWYYIYHTFVTKIQPRTLIMHSADAKAKENLDLVKEYLTGVIVQTLFSELLQSDINSRGELNFDYAIEGAIPRKESHFVACSMWTSTGGQHFSLFLLDDLCVKENTDSIEKNRQVLDVYAKIPYLDDKSGLYKVLEVGTAYTDDCHHAIVHNLYANGVKGYHVVSCPVEYIDENGETVYNFPDRWNKESIEQALAGVNYDMTIHNAQLNQIFYRRDQRGINLHFSKQFNTFKDFPDSERYAVITAGDPSTSRKNKRDGDASSRATILTARLYDDETFYVCGLWQSKGEELEGWMSALVQEFRTHKTDVYIQDAQGTQEHHFQFQMKHINQQYPNKILAIPHKKTPITGTYDKLEIAAAMLASRFVNHKIFIHESLLTVMKQIERYDAGFDIIDCLVYIVVHAKPYHILTAMSNRKRGDKSKQSQKKIPLTGSDNFKLN